MRQPSSLYKRHRFPGEIIRHAVWRYYRFLLSYRDVEELLAERGIAVSDETIRRWCRTFGQSARVLHRHGRRHRGVVEVRGRAVGAQRGDAGRRQGVAGLVVGEWLGRVLPSLHTDGRGQSVALTDPCPPAQSGHPDLAVPRYPLHVNLRCFPALSATRPPGW
jgi:hypothetical protein